MALWQNNQLKAKYGIIYICIYIYLEIQLPDFPSRSPIHKVIRNDVVALLLRGLSCSSTPPINEDK